MNAMSAPKFSISAPNPYASPPFMIFPNKSHVRCAAPNEYVLKPATISNRKAPISATAPTRKTLLRGTRLFASTAPKNDLGNALLRPIPYNNLAAPICAPSPDPKFASNNVNPTIGNKGAQARPATYEYAVFTSGNGSEAGQINCATYTSIAERTPITTQVNTVASRIFRLGFSASSESVEIPSNPIYVSTAIDVHPNSPAIVNVFGS